MNYNNFNMALAAGTKGEQLAASILDSLGYTLEEVTNQAEYQKLDIDFIVYKGSDTFTLEVKADSRINQTNNICVETITNKQLMKRGWFFTTEATVLAFVDTVGRRVHIVNTNELRELYRRSIGFLRHTETEQIECGYFYKRAEIALIPLKEVKKLPSYRCLTALSQYFN